MPVFLRKTAIDLRLSGRGDEAEIFDLKNLPTEFEIGVDAGVTGKASAEYIEAAVSLWREGKIDAICHRAYQQKKRSHLGGYDFPGPPSFWLRSQTRVNSQ